MQCPKFIDIRNTDPQRRVVHTVTVANVDSQFEVSFNISDASGRTVMSGKLDNWEAEAAEAPAEISCMTHRVELA